MNIGPMLNLYPDSLGGKLSAAVRLLENRLNGAFSSVYLLPSVFHTDLDRGFSVISYDLNRKLATADDLARLKALGLDLKLDFILNHLSVLSPQFQDLLEKGSESPYRDFFIDWNRFWAGHGTMTEHGWIQPDPDAIRGMMFRKAGLPLLMVRFPDGSEVPYWNTFYQQVRYAPVDAPLLMKRLHLQYAEAEELADTINPLLASGTAPEELPVDGGIRDDLLRLLAERRSYLGQMDLNLASPLVWAYYAETLKRLADYGAAIVRLDAFAYAPKGVGRRNFLNEPETWQVLQRVAELARPGNVTLLPEIHATYAEATYRTLKEQGYMTYDFFLPGLMIDAIEHHDPAHLAAWAKELNDQKIRTVNMLGCHDGIPMLDLKGLLPDERIQSLIDLIVQRGGLIKNLHGAKNVYYQVNATYYSALGADDRKMLLARAIQLFMPGKPQIWYLDLFAGQNDLEAVQRGGDGAHKEINRTNLDAATIEKRLELPLVRRQLALLKLRNRCSAFAEDADFSVRAEGSLLHLTWRHEDRSATLVADLTDHSFRVEADLPEGPVVWSEDFDA